MQNLKGISQYSDGVIVQCYLPGILLDSDDVAHLPDFRLREHPRSQLVQQAANDQEWVDTVRSDYQEAVVILTYPDSSCFFLPPKDSGLQQQKQAHS